MARTVVTEFNEKDFHMFTRISNDSGLTVSEKIQEIVDMYLIIERNKFRQSRF
jgi:hypothetical protein